jgi:hypothetical protein
MTRGEGTEGHSRRGPGLRPQDLDGAGAPGAQNPALHDPSCSCRTFHFSNIKKSIKPTLHRRRTWGPSLHPSSTMNRKGARKEEERREGTNRGSGGEEGRSAQRGGRSACTCSLSWVVGREWRDGVGVGVDLCLLRAFLCPLESSAVCFPLSVGLGSSWRDEDEEETKCWVKRGTPKWRIRNYPEDGRRTLIRPVVSTKYGK